MSGSISPSEFEAFFRALHGPTTKPFLWQQRLAEQVCDGEWPDTLALPTASGKTACIDIAIFALACQASRGPSEERTSPRRIFFVVDRRVIVDQAYRRTRTIAKRLCDGRGADGEIHAILERAAEALRRIGGLEPEEPPLLCGQLRGGIFRDQTWARTPTQPTVLASTVDQIGSRLLFRGYGVSDSLRPIHAGLASNDALILLDEAHCSEPFRQTVSAIRGYRDLVEDGALKHPFHLAVLSATPTAGDRGARGQKIFSLKPEERTDERLAPRLEAAKPVQLLVVPVSGKEEKKKKALAARLVEEAEALADRDGLKTIAIFVNRVATAREVVSLLRARRADRADVVLMTGRLRSLDRDQILDRWEGRLRSDRTEPDDRPIFVVATQCLEVGADFDFDGLVTECASLDALRQRFGRLNRLGSHTGARGAILIRNDQLTSETVKTPEEVDVKLRDPIYGPALPLTWNWLLERAKAPVDGEPAVIDFGVNAFDGLLLTLKAGDGAWLNAPSPAALVMLPSHLDCLAQTAPSPDPDPDVSLFLHGRQEGAPAVQVCWRADLDPRHPGRWAEALSLSPPSASECMPVPITTLRRWLDDDEPTDPGDLEVVPDQSASDNDGLPSKRTALVWRGSKKQSERSKTIQKAEDVHPGDTVVIITGSTRPAEPADSNRKAVEHEALAAQAEAYIALNELGQTLPLKESPDLDQAERAANHGRRRRAILRIHPRRMASWSELPGLARLRELACDEDLTDVSPEDWREALGNLSNSLPEPGDPLRWLGDLAAHLAADEHLKILEHPDHPSRAPVDMDASKVKSSYCGGVVLVGSQPFDPATSEVLLEADDAQTTEDDEGSVGNRVSLEEHTRGVVSRVARFADACNLPPALRSALIIAAEWHDLGKLDPRFQKWLQGGGNDTTTLLAKGFKLDRSASEKARVRSGYPSGGRHELPSVKLAEQMIAGPDRDLVLHLIASHHGHGRPFVPIVEEDSERNEVQRISDPVYVSAKPKPVCLDVSTDAATHLHRLGSGVAERFWILTRRYGWWGLAWLESLLRLADHRQSEAEQDRRETKLAEDAPKIWATPVTTVDRSARTENTLRLAGPDGGNPLGFLTTLGILRTLSGAWPGRRVRMSWSTDGMRKPVLHIEGDSDPSAIVKALDARLKRMRGDDLWSIGPDLTLEPVKFARAARAAQRLAIEQRDRTQADFLAAFGCEATTTERASGAPLIQDTALRTMSGAGHQHFIESMSLIVSRTEPEHIEKTVFHTWTYDDAVEKQTLRWDPADDVRRALRWRDPSGDPRRKRRGGMLGANRLAIEGLPLLPTIPVGRSLRTTGFSSRTTVGTYWTWPLWSEPLGLDVVRSLLSHPDLPTDFDSEASDREADALHRLGAIGVFQVFRSRRITVDKFRSFTPAQPL